MTTTADFAGEIIGDNVEGVVDYQYGSIFLRFGTWEPNNIENQGQWWYDAGLLDEAEEYVWKPMQVEPESVTMNCVIQSYMPLDQNLLGLNPVRLPIDGKVSIFRDGYIICLQHTQQTTVNSSAWLSPLSSDVTVNMSRTGVTGVEVYEMPTVYDIDNGDLISPKVITEMAFSEDVGYVQQYEADLVLGTVKFLSGFSHPVDSQGNRRDIVIRDTYEDLCLASDVQVTGHIAITQPLTHTYPAAETTVSSVLPIGDMQSRAYGEFEQSSWNNVWSDVLVGSAPLASANFVDYPITVFNISCTKERWALQFTSSTNLRVIGENIGILAENINVITYGGLVEWVSDDTATGLYLYGGVSCLICGNRQFPGHPFWILPLDAFGLGWASGNIIRFNTDAANFPITFVRTTLQAPATTDPNDYYTLQVRGDYS